MMRQKDFITLEELATALENKFNFNKEVALDVASRVMNYFGFGDTVIDNLLTQDDRRLFYFLQDMGLISTEWDEIFLPSGRGWRIFYWRLNIPKILEYASLKTEEEKEEEIEIYNSLPENVWCRQDAA